MGKLHQIFYVAFILIFLASCKKQTEQTTDTAVETKETYSSGELSVYVEESVVPIFEDLTMVFESEYPKAKLHTKASSENRIVNLLAQDSIRLAIMPRKLTEKEVDYFKDRVTPVQTAFAKDAIVFVANKSFQDTLVNYADFLNYMKNPEESKYHFVFENVNSTLVNQLMREAEIKEIPDRVYFRNNAEEVLALVSQHNNLVGVIGLNWLVQPNDTITELMDDIQSLAVYNETEQAYFKANQSTIADGTYPLTREIYVIDLQGKTGLGKGFASFAASDKGQRIVLKSGLLPVKMPTRQINIQDN